MLTSPPLTHNAAKNLAERDEWERRALREMQRVYSEQMARIMAALSEDLSEFEMQQRLDDIYRDEPRRVSRSIRPFFREMLFAVSLAAFLSVGGSGDVEELPPERVSLMERYLDETGRLFGDRISINSRRLTFERVEQWRDEGGTFQELIDGLEPIWEGPRPLTAARTETTRIVGEARFMGWEEGEVWGYSVLTREDGRVSEGGRVRDHHQDAADNGPYPLSNRRWQVPINGDYGCRCVNVAQVLPPEGIG